MTKEKENGYARPESADKESFDGESCVMDDEGFHAEGDAPDANVSEQKTAGTDNSTADEWKDKFLRLAAEFDNYRKRTLREKADLITAGGEDVIKSLLGIGDDLDRALCAVERASDLDALKEGVLLIAQKLDDVLRSKGVTEIPAMGLPFDTDLHEAVAKIPAPDKKHKGKIVDVVQKGYKLKDKVVRYAKVVVGE